MRQEEQREILYQQMINAYGDLMGTVPDEATDPAIRFRVLADELAQGMEEVQEAENNALPQLAQGKALDAHAAARGLERGQAARAVGILTFTAEKAVELPAGTVCRTQDGWAYETLEPASLIPEAPVTVQAQSVEAGPFGNALEGAVQVVAGRQDCQVTSSAFTGGCDQETDERLRRRVLESWANPSNGANRGYYLAIAQKRPQITHAQVQANPEGGVLLTVAGEAQLPESLLLELSQEVEALREPTCSVTVVQAPIETVSISLQYEGGKASAQEVEEGLAQAARRLVNGSGIGAKVPLSTLYACLMATGLAEGVLVVSPQGDLKAETGKVLRCGEITVGEVAE